MSINPPGVNAINPEFDPTATYNFSLGVQRDIGFNTVLDVAYVGSLARHLLATVEPQCRALRCSASCRRASTRQYRAATTPLPDNFLRPIKGYADIQLIETGGEFQLPLAAGAVESPLLVEPFIRRELHLVEGDDAGGRQ